ncbi:DUF1501 domain-containing protein [Synechococcus sp. RSCCF101]|uniref:DUF1501 domain-containing protein n=1 Tax=Synechococcus sp. RSCCF101 TaxID=2511069 RepID=UPI0012456C7A|nr:DUF1501 domain-containing protein [Synechococcus sp. RSCCF101]QEY32431.1 DUF1501 domain-containing protein [Synechococcus sp. RSCCF101]
MKRRDLMALGLLGAGGALVSGSRVRGLWSPAAARVRSGERVLVWLELRGGNDGLNTVIPHRDPRYRQARPRLAIRDPLPLTDTLALHPALAPLQRLWDSERLSLVLGLGWSAPSRSHFQATDQWASGRASGQGPGWLAEAMDRGRFGRPTPLIALGRTGTAAIEGGTALALQLSGADLRSGTPPPPVPATAAGNPLLQRMLELERDAGETVARLRQDLAPLPSGTAIPATGLGGQLRLALRLIASPEPPAVIALEQAGYDTHAHQLGRHQRLLSQLAEALAGFDGGLRRLRSRPPVTVLVTSEFGRRLRENASGGTDHGSASVALLAGDGLGQRLIGSYPSLGRLDPRGDLIPSLAPPALYRRVLDGSL